MSDPQSIKPDELAGQQGLYRRPENNGIIATLGKKLAGLGSEPGKSPEKHFKAKLIIVLVLVLLSALIAGRYFFGQPSVPTGPMEYYYDLSSGKLFGGEPGLASPIPAPSGGQVEGQDAGVRAAVFSCGDCGDEASYKVVYVEKLTPDTRKALIEKQAAYKDNEVARSPHVLAEIKEQLDQGQMIARVENPVKWLQESSPDGQAVMADAATLCNGGPGKRCQP